MEVDFQEGGEQVPLTAATAVVGATVFTSIQHSGKTGEGKLLGWKVCRKKCFQSPHLLLLSTVARLTCISYINIDSEH